MYQTIIIIKLASNTTTNYQLVVSKLTQAKISTSNHAHKKVSPLITTIIIIFTQAQS